MGFYRVWRNGREYTKGFFSPYMGNSGSVLDYDEYDLTQAFAYLLEYIEGEDKHIDTGVLGGRVLFHVLAQYGYADLAYDIMLNPTAPSYAQWISAGYTSLAEDFWADDIQIGLKKSPFLGGYQFLFYQAYLWY